MLQAVLFDLDLTLGRPVGDMAFAERQAHLYASVGLPYTAEAIAEAMQRRRDAVSAGRLTGAIGPQRRRDLITAYRQTLRLLGYEGDVTALAQRLYEGYARLPLVPYDDARPTLEALAARGFRLGIVSNHTPVARPAIEALFGDLVPSRQILISGEEGVHKPRPTLFRRGAARLRTPPAQCAFVGDNLIVDATAAVAAGFGLGVWVDREGVGEQGLPPGVRRVTRLEEVLGLVSRTSE